MKEAVNMTGMKFEVLPGFTKSVLAVQTWLKDMDMSSAKLFQNHSSSSSLHPNKEQMFPISACLLTH